MSKSTDRKSAIAAYKESARPSAGIFALRCAATGAVWVGESRNLERQQTGLWFQFRQGGFPNRTLQAAWTAAGEAGFSFEPLEALDSETPPYLLGPELKTRLKVWVEKLGAAKV